MAFYITATSDHHGTISPNGQVFVESGADKIFTMFANAGYVISNVLVDGISVGAVSTYTFTGVSESHTILLQIAGVAFSVAQFRIDYPEFASDTKYPDSMITYWAGWADTMLNDKRWGSRKPYGVNLFVAHNIVLAATNRALAATATGIPGTAFGRDASMGIGPLSVSTDVQSTAEPDGGNFNATFYGVQFIRLSRIIGAGGAQV